MVELRQRASSDTNEQQMEQRQMDNQQSYQQPQIANYDMALQHAVQDVNVMQQHMAQMARGIVNALKDGRVSPMEGVSLGFKGMQLAMTMVSVMSGASEDHLDKMLYVLEHMEISVR